MNEVIGFDGRIEKLMPLQGILLSKLRRPLTIVLGFFAGSGPRTTTTTRTIRKFPRLNRPRRRARFLRRQGTEDDDDHEDDQEIPAP